MTKEEKSKKINQLIDEIYELCETDKNLYFVSFFGIEDNDEINGARAVVKASGGFILASMMAMQEEISSSINKAIKSTGKEELHKRYM